MAEIVVALDLPTCAAALRVVDAAGASCAWYKVGPALFVADGPALVRELLARGKQVFLDLKWHDIPHTVGAAVAAASGLGASLATVHVAGGPRMLAAAAQERAGGLRLVGVGVLTSLVAGDYAGIVGRPVASLGAEQERLVRMALEAGLDGFVTAAAEAPRVRRSAGPRALLVTPGIRLGSQGEDDQRRTARPAEAVRAGADLLVVGRPVTGASDPAAALLAIHADMEGAR
jgi:orotidine-5'-phosphate decarboxylase